MIRFNAHSTLDEDTLLKSSIWNPHSEDTQKDIFKSL